MPGKFTYGNIVRFLAVCWYIILSAPGRAIATQAHGAPEGIYAHQLAHIFFLISMAVLIYWLRARELNIEKGWRYIQISAFFLLLWNLDAMAVHFLEEQLEIVTITPMEGWQARIESAGDSLMLLRLFYLFKLDHLLCVPALGFLYLGLRRLIITVDDPVRDRERVG